MISKNEVKYIQSLSYKKNRQSEKVFIVEGEKCIKELINSTYEIKKIYAIEAWINQNSFVKNVVEVTDVELKQISQLQTPNQVLAIVSEKNVEEAHLNDVKGWIVALDTIQDPGNLGTIIRICDWFGIQNIVCSVNTADVYNSKVVQSSMGSSLRVNVHYAHLITWLKEQNKCVYGAVLNGTSMQEVSKQKEGILLIGNEGKGISTELLPIINQQVTIPKLGEAESLNAAVATGILLSHLINY